MTYNEIQKTGRLWLCAGMLAIKLIYILTTSLMLPDINLLWPYDKNICLDNIVFELIPFLAAVLIYVYLYRRGNMYSYFTSVFFIIFFIPVNSSLSLSSYEPDYFILSNLFSILLLLILGNIAAEDQSKNPQACVSGEQITENLLFSNPVYVWIFRGAMILVCILTLYYVYKYNGINFAILTSQMYSVRSDYAEYAVSIQGTTASYLTLIITGAGRWFLPVYLYFALTRKNAADTIICLFTIVANYTVEMQKSSLFIILVVLFVVRLKQTRKLHLAGEKWVGFFVILLAASCAEYAVTKDSVIYQVIIRRLMYVPNYMTHTYYAFFKNNQKIWFTQDAFIIQWFMRAVLKRPYEGSTVQVISANCFSGLLPSPNTGIFAEAYAQMGIAGVFVFPIINGLVIRWIGESSRTFGEGIPLVVLSRMGFTFINNFTLASSILIGVCIFVFTANVIGKMSAKAFSTAAHQNEEIIWQTNLYR